MKNTARLMNLEPAQSATTTSSTICSCYNVNVDAGHCRNQWSVSPALPFVTSAFIRHWHERVVADCSFQFLPGRAMKLRGSVIARTKQSDIKVSKQQDHFTRCMCAECAVTWVWTVLSHGCACVLFSIDLRGLAALTSVLTAAAHYVASCCCIGEVSLDLLDVHLLTFCIRKAWVLP